MSKSISQFRFKQFAVSHHRSAMKVGVDGVLIGCWADVGGCRRILDVGTGCGLIALIMAQRTPEAKIDAIDIDEPSIVEAKENIADSPWTDRITAKLSSFSNAGSLLKRGESGYDLIISNPPYFDAGVSDKATARERARHQGDLSPSVLLKGAKDLLVPNGRIAMVVPAEISDALEGVASTLGFCLRRKCMVRGRKDTPYKRVLLQWNKRGLTELEPEVEHLTLEDSPNVPTVEYRTLCKDFYLRF